MKLDNLNIGICPECSVLFSLDDIDTEERYNHDGERILPEFEKGDYCFCQVCDAKIIIED